MFASLIFFGLSAGASLVVVLCLLLILAFEIWMIINVLMNRAITPNARVLWLIGMLLIHPFVAIVYYFTDYKKNV